MYPGITSPNECRISNIIFALLLFNQDEWEQRKVIMEITIPKPKGKGVIYE